MLHDCCDTLERVDTAISSYTDSMTLSQSLWHCDRVYDIMFNRALSASFPVPVSPDTLPFFFCVRTRVQVCSVSTSTSRDLSSTLRLANWIFWTRHHWPQTWLHSLNLRNPCSVFLSKSLWLQIWYAQNRNGQEMSLSDFFPLSTVTTKTKAYYYVCQITSFL